MSSESPLRVRDGNEGVGGRDGREKCYPNEVIDRLIVGLIRVGVISGRGRVSPRGRVGVGGG